MLLGDLSVSLSVDTEADPADTEMTRNQADKARYYTDKCVKKNFSCLLEITGERTGYYDSASWVLGGVAFNSLWS